MTASFGVAGWKSNVLQGSTFDALVARCDEGVYASKAAGRNASPPGRWTSSELRGLRCTSRIAAYVAAGLFGLIVIALVLVVVFVDPNDYRDDIQKMVEQKTGRALTLGGDLKLSVFPWIALETGPASLGDAPARPGAVRLDQGSARRRAAAAAPARQDQEVSATSSSMARASG